LFDLAKKTVHPISLINFLMKLTIVFSLFVLPFCVFSQDTLANHYKIYSVAKQKIVSLDDITADMLNADVLFFGEEHNDSTDHYLEYHLFKKINQKYPGKTALSTEMFETDCQNVLNEYLSGFIREKNFVTDARAWHNYKDYRPLIEWAKDNKIPVVAANAPNRYTNMANRLGLQSLTELSAQGKSYLPPLPIDTATGTYYDKFLQVMGGHAAMGACKCSRRKTYGTLPWAGQLPVLQKHTKAIKYCN